MESLEPRDWLLSGAIAIGIVFGLVGRVSGFCFRSAILEAVEGRPGRQIAAWLGALAAAVVGTQALAAVGLIDLAESIYLSRTVAWGGLILGGLVFGFGMMMTRGCGARHLVLAAGGNLRSVVVLTSLGLSAYATLRGVLAVPRTWIAESASIGIEAPDQSLVTLLATATDADSGVVRGLLVAGLVGAGCVVLARTRWRTPIASALVAGALIGLLVPAAWYVTGVLAFDEFEPGRPESLTFTAPVGNAIQYLLTYTGASADFGIAAVGGVLIGAFAAALGTRRLRAEGFEGPAPLARYMLGGALMGAGGVLALGCTIGAGLSGVSTLSAGSVLAAASIGSGGWLAIRLARVEHPGTVRAGLQHATTA